MHQFGNQPWLNLWLLINQIQKLHICFDRPNDGKLILSRFASCVPLNILPRLSCIIFTFNLTEPAGTIAFRKSDDCNSRMNNLFVNNVGVVCINLILPARIVRWTLQHFCSFLISLCHSCWWCACMSGLRNSETGSRVDDKFSIHIN